MLERIPSDFIDIMYIDRKTGQIYGVIFKTVSGSQAGGQNRQLDMYRDALKKLQEPNNDNR